MLSCPYQNSNGNENKHEKTGGKSLPLTVPGEQIIPTTRHPRIFILSYGPAVKFKGNFGKYLGNEEGDLNTWW